MRPLSISKLIARRLVNEWRLLLPIFVGITVASTLVAGAPIYVESLQRLGINTRIDKASQASLDMRTFAPYVPLKPESLERTELMFQRALDSTLAPVKSSLERHLRTDPLLAGTPRRGLPDKAGRGVTASVGFLQTFTNLESHVSFREGQMAGDIVEQGPEGPIVEGVVGSELAAFFRLERGSTVVLTPSLANPIRVAVRIVGVIDATDPTERYWSQNARQYLNPQPLEEALEDEVEAQPGESPVAIFVSRRTVVEAIGKSYPASLGALNYFMGVDKAALKRWTADEMSRRLAAFDAAISETMPGSIAGTGLFAMLKDFKVRRFFSQIPLLLLLTVMVATVLYFLTMMVSYLVESRTGEVALLRSRGTNTLQLLRLYSLEGLTLTAVAVVLAPFLAMGIVALAGKLPYFHEFTHGDLLPVEFRLLPFLVAAGAGLLCVAIYVIPGAIGGRAGLIIHKLRASRPPSLPFFQRYYLDIGLLVIGGLVFWELYSRGYLVSGGLFKDVEVNEALLLAPVLFLTFVALLFMRFFPLFVRFAAGESPALLHLLAAATVLVLAGGLVVREVRGDDNLGWVWPVVILGAFAAAYWTGNYARRVTLRSTALVAQALLVALFLAVEPPSSRYLLYIPSYALVAVVPLQVLYLGLRRLVGRAPVWVSIALVHMSRNPLQYSWMVLLLVLVTGLGILSTTVGGTLDRSHEEQALYDVGADIRVTDISGDIAPGTRKLKELYLTIPGVTAVNMGFRARGKVGTGATGLQFEALGVESQDFPYITWYRDDFSRRPLGEVMRDLSSGGLVAPLTVGDGAARIGVWVRPKEPYGALFLWLVVEDARGIVTTLSLTDLGFAEWRRLQTDIPQSLQPPVKLVSVQIFEHGYGPTGTVGSILLDDIHYVGPLGDEQVMDDFEGQMDWLPLVTAAVSGDFVRPTTDDAHSGTRSGVYSFGKETNAGLRGIHHRSAPPRIPVVVNSALADATGTRVGDAFISEIASRMVPVVVRDVISYFPTLRPREGDAGFMLVDMETLLSHLNMLTPTFQVTPNELFVKEAPGADQAVREVVYSLVSNPSQVHDRESQVLQARIDPLITAGWRVMVLISVGIIVFVAGMGYVIYLLSFANRSRNEMGFLQSLGLSRRQLMGLLGLEHLAIATVGLGLGSWAGFQMSRIMVSSLAVTEKGKQVVPPFILTTDWGIMLVIYGIVALIFVAALYALNRSIRALDLHEVARMEG